MADPGTLPTRARIIVAIELVNGGRAQAVCRTGKCAAGEGANPWQGKAYTSRGPADLEASQHRDWHHLQLEAGDGQD